jgi:hypothetical protein
MEKPDCYRCKYRGDVPGDGHSCCRYPGNKTGLLATGFEQSNKENAVILNIKAVAHGVRMGWFMWPVNFDPTWLVNCDGFTEKENL